MHYALIYDHVCSLPVLFAIIDNYNYFSAYVKIPLHKFNPYFAIGYIVCVAIYHFPAKGIKSCGYDGNHNFN